MSFHMDPDLKFSFDGYRTGNKTEKYIKCVVKLKLLTFYLLKLHKH